MNAIKTLTNVTVFDLCANIKHIFGGTDQFYPDQHEVCCPIFYRVQFSHTHPNGLLHGYFPSTKEYKILEEVITPPLVLWSSDGAVGVEKQSSYHNALVIISRQIKMHLEATGNHSWINIWFMRTTKNNKFIYIESVSPIKSTYFNLTIDGYGVTIETLSDRSSKWIDAASIPTPLITHIRHDEKFVDYGLLVK